ncbi:MAG: DUF5659 domain-containing protein [Candidatus Margulisiibacteriota bacterium]|jgi:hypothetical protein
MNKNESLANYDTYSSTDLGCATGLVSLGFELFSLDRSTPSRVKFIFQKRNKLEETVEAYWADALAVNPRIYFNNLKNIKSLIYGGV